MTDLHQAHELFLQPDGTLLPVSDILQFWRASLDFYYAWLMGWENISVYDGGWFEWSQSCFAQQ